MSKLVEFMDQFDEQGCFKDGSGVIDVVFTTIAGGRNSGKLHFANGLCVRADFDVANPRVFLEVSPPSAASFLVQFDDEATQVVKIAQGRVGVYPYRNDRAKDVFLQNLRLARNLFVHPQASKRHSANRNGSAGAALAKKAIWLTPTSVRGFDEEDFPELGPARQKELLEAVHHFEEIARQISADAPTTAEQYQSASVYFGVILAILDRYLFPPDESVRIEKVMSAIELPPWILNWNTELGEDSDGGPAAWIDLFVDENDMPADRVGRDLSDLSLQIRQAFSNAEIARWPFVGLRSAIEHQTAAR